MTDELLTAEEAAKLLTVKPATLASWRNMNTGPEFVRLTKGSRAPVRYKRSTIMAYIEARTIKTGKA